MASGPEPLRSLLRQLGRTFVLDGGLATELEHQGKNLSQDKLWSARILADDPQAVQAAHLAYYTAGADVATTCSYQATFEGLAQAGIGTAEAEQLLRRSVALAHAARTQFRNQSAEVGSKQLLVAFSCGPYGTVLADGSEYNGNYAESVTEEELIAFHRRRLQVIAHDPTLDILAFETIPCAKEVAAIVRLLDSESFGKPAWLSMSCSDDTHTSHGEDYAATCIPLLAACKSIAAVGFNCTAPRHIAGLLLKARQALERAGHADKFLLAYPNSGEGYISAAGGWQGDPDLTAEQYGIAAERWASMGATLIGGCCRTTPDHIRSVVAHTATRL